ncbi:hypothetical protein ACFWB2_43100 [Streptomyces virginiae]|uniref:hypothetical protein n=1 Tax=Streptomyces virginiae TaxID=1961 RepID=UPI0036CFF913
MKNSIAKLLGIATLTALGIGSLAPSAAAHEAGYSKGEIVSLDIHCGVTTNGDPMTLTAVTTEGWGNTRKLAKSYAGFEMQTELLKFFKINGDLQISESDGGSAGEQYMPTMTLEYQQQVGYDPASSAVFRAWQTKVYCMG